MAANLISSLALLLLLGLLSQLVSANQLSLSKLHSPVLQESIVKEINDNPDAGWRAAMSPRLSNYTVGAFMHLLGVKKLPKEELTPVSVVTHPKSLKLPASFDAREAWPQCATIGRILDQGHCGSCWAFAAVEALSDRFCIQFGKNTSLSVNDLLACCDDCGAGCAGGIPLAAWAYFVQHGVVTEECDPYFDQIGCSHPGCEPVYPTPKCVRHCAEGKLQVWEKSKRYSANVYSIDSDDPHSIMAEVYKNGPVEVSFTVYEDFAHYKSGVYKHILGDDLGGHAVKLIGWGTSSDGEDYWLIANQWNKGWGDDGYFKIKRGTNECGIEDEAVAGLASSRNFISMGAFGDVASV